MLRDQLDAIGPTATFVELLRQHLGDWLVDHIATSDRALGEFLRGQHA